MQQFSLIDLFIDLFEAAVHVSDDKLAYLQEHFLTVYTAFGTHNAPILLPTGRQQYWCIVPNLYIQSKSAPEDGRVCRPKHVEQIRKDQ